MKTLCYLTMMLLCGSVAMAEETFFSALESKAEVEKEDGTVDGGSFKPGKFGNGFVSEKVGDVIHFPVKDRFVNLDEGTVELWVTMGLNSNEINGELFLFMTYKRGSAMLYFYSLITAGSRGCGLKVLMRGIMPIAPLSGGKRAIITTWRGHGESDGLKLYLDGELEGESNFKRGPILFAPTFEINNASPPDPNFPTNCVVDGLRLSDHQKEVDELVMDDPASVQPTGKLTTSWGRIKRAK